MEKLQFFRPDGELAFTWVWDASDADYDAMGWLEDYGPRIGKKPAPLPNGVGWIDLAAFSVVAIAE